MPFKPSGPGEFPTLGWEVLDWMSAMLASPRGGVEKAPFVLYDEQARFVLNLYRLDPWSGARVYRRAVLGRPRGWGKSPLLAALAAVEALGPVVFDGWDSTGQPVGRPWSVTTNPRIQIAAVSDAQTKNSWDPLLEMLRNGPVIDAYPGLVPLDGVVQLPGAGSIEKITSSAKTVKGAPSQMSVLDQTEEWVPSNGGDKLSENMRGNATKVNGITIESPNAFIPGARSVAEKSWLYAQKIEEGKVRDPGLLYDNRAAPPVDLDDREELVKALYYVYGDSARRTLPDGTVTGHVDIDRVAADAYDPAIGVETYKRDFLNQITTEADAFVKPHEWEACGPHDGDPLWQGIWTPPKPITADDAVVLGFDGSRSRVHGVADATALVAVRVADGLAWPVRVWEEPDGPESKDWVVPEAEVEATLAQFMAEHNVVGFRADQSRWEANVARWEARWGPQMRIGAKAHPIAWHTGTSKVKTAAAIQQLRDAILQQELHHTGAPVLTRHIINARVRMRSYGPLLFKKNPSSPDKIDAVYALTLAWSARLEALSVDLTPPKKPTSFVPARIR